MVCNTECNMEVNMGIITTHITATPLMVMEPMMPMAMEPIQVQFCNPQLSSTLIQMQLLNLLM